MKTEKSIDGAPVPTLVYISGANFSGATKASLDVVERLAGRELDCRVVFAKHTPGAGHVLDRLERREIPYVVMDEVLPAGLAASPLGRRLDRLAQQIVGSAPAQARLGRLMEGFSPQIALTNGRPFSELGPGILPDDCRRVYMIHFVPPVIDRLPAADIAEMGHADAVVAVSDTQRRALAVRGIPAGISHVITNGIDGIAPDDTVRARFRGELNAAPDEVVAAGVGVANLRKGTDRFLRMAQLAVDDGEATLRFLWLGSNSPDGLIDEAAGAAAVIEDDLRQLAGKVRFVGPVPNPIDYMNAIDIFVMTSRTEAAPLAMIEAMWLAKPVVSFAGCGFSDEVLPPELLAPADDVAALAQRVRELAADPVRRAAMGGRMREIARERFDLDTQCHRLRKVILGADERRPSKHPVTNPTLNEEAR